MRMMALSSSLRGREGSDRRRRGEEDALGYRRLRPGRASFAGSAADPASRERRDVTAPVRQVPPAGCGTDAPGPEPGRAEILESRLIMNGLLSGFYRRYVDEMGLRGDERVLDYGSGGGAAARHLAKRLEAGGGHLTCMDVSVRWQGVVKRVLRAHTNVEYRLGDVRALALPAGGFDVVVVHWMLHDVPPADRPSILTELARLLRPDGRLFVREPTSSKHGMPAAEARRLLVEAGFAEQGRRAGKALIPGRYYSGVWVKPA